MTSAAIDSTSERAVSIANMPMTGKDYWIVLVSSMEQIIGAALSTIVGIMIPMIQLISHSGLSSVVQGLIGATPLVGIAVGSIVIGKLSDRQGYLPWFRICPMLIIAGGLLTWLFPNTWCLIAGMFLAGLGTGGGYSLDSAYISELLPEKWCKIMVGVAKALCTVGFLGAAAICWWILTEDPNPKIWSDLMLIIIVLGVATLAMRIRWYESPAWLVSKNRIAEAEEASRKFFGPGVTLPELEEPASPKPEPAKASWGEMLHGENLKRVIFSGIPWACEGLGVYGFGVFLPILVMALGLESSSTSGMDKVVNSVEVTALVNFFILPGFVVGLLLMRRMSNLKMLVWGFILSAVGLALLYLAYVYQLPKWVMIVGFLVFEVALNAGPHLITFIIPSAVFPVDIRSTGSGIAAMIGKVGAVLGVIMMPILVALGGAKLVLIVSGIVMLLGALIAQVYGRSLMK